MEKFKKLFVLFSVLLLFFSFSLFAQTPITVRGTVTDNQGSPLPAAIEELYLRS